MSLRRLITILGVTVVATSTFVVAAPAAKKKAPTPVAPAKDPAAPGSGSGSGASDASGSAVQPIEDTPPSDMNGTTENPDNPHAMTNEEPKVAAAPDLKPTGYPIQEVLRPITLPQNMTEISIAPHLQFSPFLASDAVHVRYGITSQVQLGLTYQYFGAYPNNFTDSTQTDKIKFHSGKAFGVDVTVLLQNWLGVRVGVPVWVNPVAFALELGAPIKFTFGDKFAIGGLGDLLTIRLSKFAPSLYQEAYNAVGTQNEVTHTEQSNGHLRFAFFGEYQQSDKLVFIGRIGIDSDLGATSGGGGAGTASTSGTATFIKVRLAVLAAQVLRYRRSGRLG